MVVIGVKKNRNADLRKMNFVLACSKLFLLLKLLLLLVVLVVVVVVVAYNKEFVDNAKLDRVRRAKNISNSLVAVTFVKSLLLSFL